MFDKCVTILLCFALIDSRLTKSLKRENPSYETEAETKLDTETNNLVKFFAQYANLLQEKSQKNQHDKWNENLNNLESQLKNNREDETNQEKFAISETQKTSKTDEIRIDAQKKGKPVNADDQSEVFLKQAQKYVNEFGDLKDLLRRNINQDVKHLIEMRGEPEVGFGGNSKGDPKRITFGNMTTYVNKVINQTQQNLNQVGPRIYVYNPPYVIYRIPNIPIIFNLDYIEGASSITKQGTSMGLHYFNALYCYIHFKFDEIRYYYDVQVKPMYFFAFYKRITVVLKNARVWMPVAVENNTLIVQQFEYVQPDVTVEVSSNSFINYIFNDVVINKCYPDAKQKLVEIASRDTKILLEGLMKNAQ